MPFFSPRWPRLRKPSYIVELGRLPASRSRGRSRPRGSSPTLPWTSARDDALAGIAAIAAPREFQLGAERALPPRGDEIDPAAQGVVADERAGAGDQLDLLDVLQRQQVEAHLPGVRFVLADAIEEHREPVGRADGRTGAESAKGERQLERRAEVVGEADADLRGQGVRQDPWLPGVDLGLVIVMTRTGRSALIRGPAAGMIEPTTSIGAMTIAESWWKRVVSGCWAASGRQTRAPSAPTMRGVRMVALLFGLTDDWERPASAAPAGRGRRPRRSRPGRYGPERCRLSTAHRRPGHRRHSPGSRTATR